MTRWCNNLEIKPNIRIWEAQRPKLKLKPIQVFHLYSRKFNVISLCEAILITISSQRISIINGAELFRYSHQFMNAISITTVKRNLTLSWPEKQPPHAIRKQHLQQDSHKYYAELIQPLNLLSKFANFPAINYPLWKLWSYKHNNKDSFKKEKKRITKTIFYHFISSPNHIWHQASPNEWNRTY